MVDEDAIIPAETPRPDVGDNRSDAIEGDLAVREQIAALRFELAEAHAAIAEAGTREDALRHELQHRVSNMLSVVRSIYRRTRENGASPTEFAEHFEGRLNAIARSQARADRIGAPAAYLEDLLRDELLAVGSGDGSRCAINGPLIRLGGKTAELMALAIHELTTNSIKFGALARDGALMVEWFVEDRSDGALLRFAWTETGIPVAVTAPRPSGFGRQLIEQALPYQLGASTQLRFRPGGIECEISLPVSVECRVADDTEPGDLSPPFTGTP